MNLIVKYDELSTTGKYYLDKSNEIYETLDNVQKIIESVKNAWTGTDCDTFVANSTQYINMEKTRAKKVENIGNLITKLSGNYKNKDEDWGNKIKKETTVNGHRN